jgi:hypothetical protein
MGRNTGVGEGDSMPSRAEVGIVHGLGARRTMVRRVLAAMTNVGGSVARDSAVRVSWKSWI